MAAGSVCSRFCVQPVLCGGRSCVQPVLCGGWFCVAAGSVCSPLGLHQALPSLRHQMSRFVFSTLAENRLFSNEEEVR